MIKYFYTQNGRTSSVPNFCHDCWVKMTNPSNEEAELIAERMGVEVDDLMAAIDLEEKTRIELPENYTLIVVDIPSEEYRNGVRAYVTIPLGIIITKEAIVTICSEESFVLRNFEKNRMKDFSTRKKLRFVYQILLESALLYQKALYAIDRKRQEIETMWKRKICSASTSWNRRWCTSPPPFVKTATCWTASPGTLDWSASRRTKSCWTMPSWKTSRRWR